MRRNDYTSSFWKCVRTVVHQLLINSLLQETFRATPGYASVRGSAPSAWRRTWLSSGSDRAQWAVVFTAFLLKRQLSTEPRWLNTDLRQMMKTQGSTMGFSA
ncbi:hypothetical protein EYF80_034945 [Liparis tanakae]|uniref:Uncharacterized protein n=1 Tax=Liparis tanakae TaxID=230148 RepID=A0A4Z2GMT2_9TELE|nr:hypothetical protein EYF80_034945 [Liparis tanakae]